MGKSSVAVTLVTTAITVQVGDALISSLVILLMCNLRLGGLHDNSSEFNTFKRLLLSPWLLWRQLYRWVTRSFLLLSLSQYCFCVIYEGCMIIFRNSKRLYRQPSRFLSLVKRPFSYMKLSTKFFNCQHYSNMIFVPFVANAYSSNQWIEDAAFCSQDEPFGWQYHCDTYTKVMT